MWFLCLLMLLPGCGRSDPSMEQALSLRKQLLEGDGCSFQTVVTADYGQILREFTMEIQADSQGTVTFTVTKPEEISGITGTLSADRGKLTFGDQAVFFDLLADGQLSPVSAPWVFLKALRNGNITSVCQEDQGIHWTLREDFGEDAMVLDILTDETNLPINAQILYRDNRILSLTIENFQIL